MNESMGHGNFEAKDKHNMNPKQTINIFYLCTSLLSNEGSACDPTCLSMRRFVEGMELFVGHDLWPSDHILTSDPLVVLLGSSIRRDAILHADLGIDTDQPELVKYAHLLLGRFEFSEIDLGEDLLEREGPEKHQHAFRIDTGWSEDILEEYIDEKLKELMPLAVEGKRPFMMHGGEELPALYSKITSEGFVETAAGEVLFNEYGTAVSLPQRKALWIALQDRKRLDAVIAHSLPSCIKSNNVTSRNMSPRDCVHYSLHPCNIG
eukprot:2192233-Amphidinium_carterae.1